MTFEPSLEDEHGGKISILLSEPEIAIERARFIGTFPYFPPKIKPVEGEEYTQYGAREQAIEERARLIMLVGARHIRNANSIQDWVEYASEYPKTELTNDEANRSSNPDAAVRSHYVFEAIAELLELVKAPQAFRHDFELLIKRQRPRAANRRADAQKNILQTPDASLRKIADISKYDAGELSKDIKKRYVLWPGKNVT